ncbi:NAD-dependent epimerase/dehydratase family protein [Staphylococcus caprae]|uniref:polysaccharide biosynthesis C-terminal domain-containing protein n=1 Tax=Staphylococcus caprae TaxID=29380 RepID=UPI003B21CC41
MKKVVVTGSNGFVGKNLTLALKQDESYEVLEINRDTNVETRNKFLKTADVIVHLAGANRPLNNDEFEEVNVDLLNEFLKVTEQNEKKPTIILSSSIQATQNNPYGNSKRNAEIVLEEFAEKNGNSILIYRFPNLFGKWCKPNYNSVIATFCHNISRDQEIVVNDENVVLTLNYIDDVIIELTNAIKGHPNIVDGKPCVPNVFEEKLGEIVRLIYKFKNSRKDKSLPYLANPFEKVLYSTYLSYLPKDDFSYPLKMNIDERGSFTEIFKTSDRGQTSVNISKPGITKGNHWHHTKNEKFLVVAGEGVIRFRLPGDDEVIEYFVSSDKLEVIDIPVGYTHNIENLGDTDMVTIMWVNEIFNPEQPDTYYLEV